MRQKNEHRLQFGPNEWILDETKHKKKKWSKKKKSSETFWNFSFLFCFSRTEIVIHLQSNRLFALFVRLSFAQSSLVNGFCRNGKVIWSKVELLICDCDDNILSTCELVNSWRRRKFTKIKWKCHVCVVCRFVVYSIWNWKFQVFWFSIMKREKCSVISRSYDFANWNLLKTCFRHRRIRSWFEQVLKSISQV